MGSGESRAHRKASFSFLSPPEDYRIFYLPWRTRENAPLPLTTHISFSVTRRKGSIQGKTTSPVIIGFWPSCASRASDDDPLSPCPPVSPTTQPWQARFSPRPLPPIPPTPPTSKPSSLEPKAIRILAPTPTPRSTRPTSADASLGPDVSQRASSRTRRLCSFRRKTQQRREEPVARARTGQ
jgi:hypothetical protein